MPLTNELKKKLKALEERHGDLTREFDEIVKKRQEIQEAMSAVKLLLKIEGEVPADSENDRYLPDVLMDIMIPEVAYTLDELVAQVKKQGYDFGEKSPNKSVNFTLMGISRGNKVGRTVDGKWLRFE